MEAALLALDGPLRAGRGRKGGTRPLRARRCGARPPTFAGCGVRCMVGGPAHGFPLSCAGPVRRPALGRMASESQTEGERSAVPPCPLPPLAESAWRGKRGWGGPGGAGGKGEPTTPAAQGPAGSSAGHPEGPFWAFLGPKRPLGMPRAAVGGFEMGGGASPGLLGAAGARPPHPLQPGVVRGVDPPHGRGCGGMPWGGRSPPAVWGGGGKAVGLFSAR